MDKLEELHEKISEKQRIEIQFERNANTFIENYFEKASYSAKKYIKKAYLKIVRDKILY